MTSIVVEVTGDHMLLSVSASSEELASLHKGDQVEIAIASRYGRVRRRFAPGQLLREHQEILAELPVERDWVDAPAVGRELL